MAKYYVSFEYQVEANTVEEAILVARSGVGFLKHLSVYSDTSETEAAAPAVPAEG